MEARIGRICCAKAVPTTLSGKTTTSDDPMHANRAQATRRASCTWRHPLCGTGFEKASVDMPHVIALPLERLRVHVVQVSHPARQVRLGRLNEQMVGGWQRFALLGANCVRLPV